MTETCKYRGDGIPAVFWDDSSQSAFKLCTTQESIAHKYEDPECRLRGPGGRMERETEMLLAKSKRMLREVPYCNVTGQPVELTTFDGSGLPGQRLEVRFRCPECKSEDSTSFMAGGYYIGTDLAKTTSKAVGLVPDLKAAQEEINRFRASALETLGDFALDAPKKIEAHGEAAANTKAIRDAVNWAREAYLEVGGSVKVSQHTSRERVRHTLDLGSDPWVYNFFTTGGMLSPTEYRRCVGLLMDGLKERNVGAYLT